MSRKRISKTPSVFGKETRRTAVESSKTMNIEINPKVKTYKLVGIYDEDFGVTKPRAVVKLTQQEARVFNYAFALNNAQVKYVES